MSEDRRLRALERTFRASGADEDEAAWLLERVRAGELDPARLDAAAALDHPAATLAGGRRGEPLEALGRLGPEALGRAAVAAAELVVPLWEADHPEDPRPRLALAAARAWTLCPCTPHLQEARALGLQVHATTDAAGHAARAAMHCGAALGSERVVEALVSAGLAGLDRDALRAALRGALVPWLLG